MALNLRAAVADAAAPAWADQAAGLRSLLARTSVRVLPVAGSGSSSGHSAITAQLAQCAAGGAVAAQVAVLDQTGGEVARRLGLTAPHDLDDMLTGRLEFDAVARRIGAWRLLPAQRGLTRLLAAGAARPAFFRGFLALREPVTLALLNLDHDEVRLPQTEDGDGGELLLVTTPHSASMQAAYARIKQIGRVRARAQGTADYPAACTIRVLVNGAVNYTESRRVFRALADTARNFLAIEPVYAGALPPDDAGVPFGVNRRVPTPACAAALAQIAAALPAWGLAEYGLAEYGLAEDGLAQYGPDTEAPALNAGGALARVPRAQVSSARSSHV